MAADRYYAMNRSLYYVQVTVLADRDPQQDKLKTVPCFSDKTTEVI